MKTSRIFLASLVALGALKAASAADWELTDKTDDGITTYKMEIPGSDVLAFRGQGDVDAPLGLIATIIFDCTRGTEWIEDLEASKVLRWTSPTEFIEYDHIGTPFVMKDRDFVTKVTMEPDPAAKKLTITYKSVDDPSAPQTSYVRGEMIHATFVLTSLANDARTHVDADIHADPKGSVPKWIVNFFQKSWPANTFRNLRKQAKKSDVKMDPRFAEVLTRGVIAPQK
jgi:hypothetical protein